MKTFYLIVAIVFINTSYSQSAPMEKCDVDYIGINHNPYHESHLFDAGELSLSGCIDIAMNIKMSKSPFDVDFKYTYYSKISGPDLNVGSSGWYVVGTIVDEKIRPTDFTMVNFVNP